MDIKPATASATRREFSFSGSKGHVRGGWTANHDGTPQKAEIKAGHDKMEGPKMQREARDQRGEGGTNKDAAGQGRRPSSRSRGRTGVGAQRVEREPSTRPAISRRPADGVNGAEARPRPQSRRRRIWRGCPRKDGRDRGPQARATAAGACGDAPGGPGAGTAKARRTAVQQVVKRTPLSGRSSIPGRRGARAGRLPARRRRAQTPRNPRAPRERINRPALRAPFGPLPA